MPLLPRHMLACSSLSCSMPFSCSMVKPSTLQWLPAGSSSDSLSSGTDHGLPRGMPMRTSGVCGAPWGSSHSAVRREGAAPLMVKM